MKKLTTIVAACLLAGCSSLNVDGARFGAGIGKTRARSDYEGAVEKVSGTTRDARVELVNDLDEDTQAGLVLTAGTRELGEETAIDSLGVGASMRSYLVRGSVRPYWEGRIGYRYSAVSGADHLDEMTFGAALGVELSLGRGISTFAQGGFEGSFAEGYREHGPAGMVGFSVKF